MARLDPKDSYHMLFWEEAKEQLATMEHEILLAESGKMNQETINGIFRMAHSIKGSSATLGLTDMMELAHVLESLLTLVKNNQRTLSEIAVMEALLEGLDGLKAMHEGLFVEEAPSQEGLLLAQRLSRILEKKPSGKPINIAFEKGAEMLSLKALIIITALEAHGEVTVISPIDYENIEDEEFGCLELLVQTQDSEKQLLETLDSITELEAINFSNTPMELENLTVTSNASEGIELPKESMFKRKEVPQAKEVERFATESQPEPVLSAIGIEKSTVKVNIQKIDQLINLVGELIVDKETLNSITKELKLSYRKDKNVARLLEVFNHLHYLGSELQEIVLSTRMLPLEIIFSKFPRMVRDLALKCNKNIQFKVEGMEHGIDRGMIEELMDPLTHLLRNAIDHGIEDEWTRLQKGKPAAGLLKLSASQGENHVLLTIEDDGGGIDVAKVQRKALERGLISLEEAEYLSPEEWLEFIFKPGFSTAAQVSEVSGRGVGLDVVKSNISKLGGQIDVKTVLDAGTQFVIKLPLTMAIIKAMLVKEGHCTFAIPVSSIVEIFRLKDAEITERIHSTGYSQILHWREFTIPLLYLNRFFEIENRQRSFEKMYVIVIGVGEKKTALIVEEILGEQEIVIKSMGEFTGKDKLFGELTGISGVSILGDGSLAHILDVGAVIIT